MLLSLGELAASECITSLHEDGILPEIILVNVPVSTDKIPLLELSAELAMKFRLLESPAAHWIAGTGHQAVSAMLAVLDHPTFWGKAACLSTSFEGIEGAPPLHSHILRSLEERAVLPAESRLYFDYGTVGLDECYEPYHRDLGAILRGKGWRDGLEFKIVRSTGGSHEFASWNTRLAPALRWLAS